jgi:hypothetical protein
MKSSHMELSQSLWTGTFSCWKIPDFFSVPRPQKRRRDPNSDLRLGLLDLVADYAGIARRPAPNPLAGAVVEFGAVDSYSAPESFRALAADERHWYWCSACTPSTRAIGRPLSRSGREKRQHDFALLQLEPRTIAWCTGCQRFWSAAVIWRRIPAVASVVSAGSSSSPGCVWRHEWS